MDPKNPFPDKVEREGAKKPDAESKRDQGGRSEHFTDDVKRPIAEREKQSEMREHGELTEE